MSGHTVDSGIIFMILSALVLFLCADMVNAAIMSGSIYDLGLQKESNIIVEIDTVPKQMLVSKDGDYTFNVNPGNYTLYAHTVYSGSKESLEIYDDGNYTLDLILEERTDDMLADLSIGEDIGVSLDTPGNSGSMLLTWSSVLKVILLLLLAGVALYLFVHVSSRHKRNKQENDRIHPEAAEPPLDEYEHKVMAILRKEKRVTQKDLRKHLPMSEAKASLILTDLEHKGKIRKIKKGRGNILIFVKD